MEKKIFYFVGHCASHMINALPIYEKLGGEFIVLSETAKYFCESKGVNVKMIDNYLIYEFFDEIEIHKVKNTLDYLNSQKGIVFFFSMLSIISEIKNLKKIMLFHGNSLKDWFSEEKILRLNHCDHIITLTAFREEMLRKKGVAADKFVKIGMLRWDEIIKHKGLVKNQENVYQKTACYDKKIIAYFPTWIGKLTSAKFTGLEIVKNISDDYILLFRPHPLTPANIISQYLDVINKRNNILYVPENKYKDISLIDIFVVADIFIGDISSVLIDSILIDKPIILALDSKNVIDYCNICAFFKSILKKMVFFRHDPFKSEKVIEHYNPIKEIFEVVEKVNTDNAFMINQKVEKSLDKGIDIAAWDQVKNKFFYDTQGHSVEKMINFVENVLFIVE